MIVRVWYVGADGHWEREEFPSLRRARLYARRKVGDAPEVGRRYAVSADGVGTISVAGEELRLLFPKAG